MIYGTGKLIDAVNSIELLKTQTKDPAEHELLYQVKSLIMELNQYFSGGYLSPEYVEEKCNTIKRRANEIWEVKFNK
jgi:hypothetical protein